MRSDPYQERARALAVEAGLDPDAKIDRPGQRPMPTWCLFRDAARKEKLARDAEAVAADIAIKPQSAQYQNGPLKIFGKHDDATIAQMRNCMSVGNAVAGVICADGHLGYAQPVGGVISRSASPASASTSVAATWPRASTRRSARSRAMSARSSRTCTT
jgi:tRNA-splicing ligase RtcB (3'-phosphate/5'-hydroxy nucleic acid ligase)